jgi:hypothetical protein
MAQENGMCQSARHLLPEMDFRMALRHWGRIERHFMRVSMINANGERIELPEWSN